MDRITHFRGVLPPEGPLIGSRVYTPPPSKASPGGLILNALGPLRGELDAALACGDQETALRLAYAALSEVADALATHRGDLIQAWQVRIHALLVELESLPLAPQSDGTLAEQGTEVRVAYRNWAVDRAEAAAWAQNLTERFQALCPGPWRVLPAVTAATAQPTASHDGVWGIGR